MKGIVSLLLTSILFVACQNEISHDGADTGTGGGTSGGTNTYYIKAKIDGTAKTFSTAPMALFVSSGGSSAVNFTANAGGGSMEGLALGINLLSGSLTAGTTYSEDATTMDYLITGVYNPNSTTIMYTAGISTPSADALKITITSKSATEVAGTFSGAFYKQDLSNPLGTFTEFKRVTEGSFKLPVR